MRNLPEPPAETLPPLLFDFACKPDKSQIEQFVMVCVGLLATHPSYDSLSPQELYSLLLRASERSYW